MEIEFFYILPVLGIFYSWLEHVRPLRPGQPSVFRRIASLKDLIYLFINDNIQLTFQRYLSLFLSYFIWSSFSNISQYELKIHPLLAYVICFLWVDFATYVYHYCFHRFKFLWRFHEMHHSPRTMNWLAGHRNFWFENVVYDLFTGICFLFIPLPPIYMMFFALYFGHTNFMIHSNARINIGPLRYIIPTSETHYWHHARDYKYRCGCNFGSQTLIWDYIFGTVYIPKERFAIPDYLGISREFHDTVFDRTISPFLPKRVVNVLEATRKKFLSLLLK